MCDSFQSNFRAKRVLPCYRIIDQTIAKRILFGNRFAHPSNKAAATSKGSLSSCEPYGRRAPFAREERVRQQVIVRIDRPIVRIPLSHYSTSLAYTLFADQVLVVRRTVLIADQVLVVRRIVLNLIMMMLRER